MSAFLITCSRACVIIVENITIIILKDGLGLKCSSTDVAMLQQFIVTLFLILYHILLKHKLCGLEAHKAKHLLQGANIDRVTGSLWTRIFIYFRHLLHPGVSNILRASSHFSSCAATWF